jgi:hypothetical protein
MTRWLSWAPDPIGGKADSSRLKAARNDKVVVMGRPILSEESGFLAPEGGSE